MTSMADRLAGLGLSVPNRSTTIFPDGWGDRVVLEAFSDFASRPSPPPAEIVWDRKAEHRGFRRRRGLFTSPLAPLLPEPARVVPVELIEPGRGAQRLAVLLPAWNEQGLDRRRVLAEEAARLGTAVALFEIPLYGQRRAGAGSGMPIRTVADFALLGLGAVDEATAILSTLSSDFPHLGVAGFSMGGTLAALVSARSTVPIATGLMAAAHSPAPVYLDGALARAVSWRALGGRSARPALRELLETVSTRTFPARPHHTHAVGVAARADGFVPPGAVQELADHWPGCEIAWVEGGHAGLRLRHRTRTLSALVDSFDRLTGPA